MLKLPYKEAGHIIFVLMHAREMIYRSFSKSNATRKEKKERSHLHHEFNMELHDIEDFSSTKIKKERGEGD